MSDSKLFTRSKAADLRQELLSEKKDKNYKNKKAALKKIVANMTMSNNEMITLLPDVVSIMSINDIDIKKLCFLFLLTYSKAKPDLAIRAIPILVKDLSDPSPLIRALSLRTMSAIPVREFFDAILIRISDLLHDKDPYVCKTAAYGVAKLWNHDHKAVEDRGLIDELNQLLSHKNPIVVAASLAALSDITEKTADLELAIDRTHAFNLANMLSDCDEWSQNYILSALMNFVPQTQNDAVFVIERVLPRLQHANSSVVLGTVRLIVYLINYVSDLDRSLPNLEKRITPAFVILLAKPPEIQYLALRNCIILLQSRPDLLKLDVKDFLTNYNDQIYVKATKLEIIFLLANEKNIKVVLRELRECATEIDVQIAHKSVRAIGKLAIKIESAADACVDELMDLVSTKISYIIQEATVVLKNIFRRYPNRYERVIPILCDNLESLDEPEAKAAMIWIIGNYSSRIENADELLESFLSTFKEDTVEVQLTLLTAIVKFFIYRPSKAQHLVPRVLGWATEESDNPDVRDRGYMYWRLLSADPKAAKSIVAGEDMPIINSDSDRMSNERLEELELAIGTLATIYLKPIKQVFRLAKVRQLPESPALAPRVQRPALKTRQSTPNLKTRPSLPSSSSSSGSPMRTQSNSTLSRSQSLSQGMQNMSLGRSNTFAGTSLKNATGSTRFVPGLPSVPQQAPLGSIPPQPSLPSGILYQQQHQQQSYTDLHNNSEHLGSLLIDTPTSEHAPVPMGNAAIMPMFQQDYTGSLIDSTVVSPGAGNVHYMQNNESGYFTQQHGLSSAAISPGGMPQYGHMQPNAMASTSLLGGQSNGYPYAGSSSMLPLQPQQPQHQ
ncbi:uncharacterized protein SAPINGB_P001862 [Magnusiomyces paraingens]|uniref:AP complex subunit beta n=1 Tax=Magnusiomyces paraingens TaxID=2606893 RepID=A0A5E8BD29_9ASCO|nr:uncharacterized protein SAPINGB_P001862 [Saprochaete ingens]VVT48607.1 unnamed protein product [Saprochaete ingens]